MSINTVAQRRAVSRSFETEVEEPKATAFKQTLSAADFEREAQAVLSPLRNYARRLSNGDGGVEDLVQETLLRAWKARERFEPGTSFKAWTFRILKNVFLTERRRASMELRRQVIEQNLWTVAVPEGDAALLAKECDTAFRHLPLGQRQALFSIIRDGLSYEESALRLDVPVGTVKSRVRRAKSAVLRYLEDGKVPAPQPVPKRVRHRGLIG